LYVIGGCTCFQNNQKIYEILQMLLLKRTLSSLIIPANVAYLTN